MHAKLITRDQIRPKKWSAHLWCVQSRGPIRRDTTLCHAKGETHVLVSIKRWHTRARIDNYYKWALRLVRNCKMELCHRHGRLRTCYWVNLTLKISLQATAVYQTATSRQGGSTLLMHTRLLSSESKPHKKLLGGGFSTPVPLFCLICTINPNKTGRLDQYQYTPQVLAAMSFLVSGSTPAGFREGFSAGRQSSSTASAPKYIHIYVYKHIETPHLTRTRRHQQKLQFTRKTQSKTPHTPSAQECRNRTLIGHEPLVCSEMCFSKTELSQ